MYFNELTVRFITPNMYIGKLYQSQRVATEKQWAPAWSSCHEKGAVQLVVAHKWAHDELNVSSAAPEMEVLRCGTIVQATPGNLMPAMVRDTARLMPRHPGAAGLRHTWNKGYQTVMCPHVIVLPRVCEPDRTSEVMTLKWADALFLNKSNAMLLKKNNESCLDKENVLYWMSCVQQEPLILCERGHCIGFDQGQCLHFWTRILSCVHTGAVRLLARALSCLWTATMSCSWTRTLFYVWTRALLLFPE